jgi:hypothetical protein
MLDNQARDYHPEILAEWACALGIPVDTTIQELWANHKGTIIQSMNRLINQTHFIAESEAPELTKVNAAMELHSFCLHYLGTTESAIFESYVRIMLSKWLPKEYLAQVEALT